MRTRTDLVPTTRGKYDGLLRLHILPRFDRVELGQMSATAGHAWCHKLRDRYPKGSTADDTYRVASPCKHAFCQDTCYQFVRFPRLVATWARADVLLIDDFAPALRPRPVGRHLGGSRGPLRATFHRVHQPAAYRHVARRHIRYGATLLGCDIAAAFSLHFPGLVGQRHCTFWPALLPGEPDETCLGGTDQPC